MRLAAHTVTAIDDGWEYERQQFLLTVKKNGMELKFASHEFRGDYEIVMAAVSQSGLALEFALEELKSERSIVLASVAQDGAAIVHAAEFFREVADIVDSFI